MNNSNWIDMWTGEKFEKQKYRVDIFFNDLSGHYSGNIYDKDGFYIGDYKAESWNFITENFITQSSEPELVPTKEESFQYQMLSRLLRDCKYYLGYGNRHAKHLWALNEKEHIAEMKRLYNLFSDDKKPEWLTWEEILEYEKQMCYENV